MPAPVEVMLQDWHAAKLLKPSAIKPVIATLEQSLIIKNARAAFSARPGLSLKEMIGKIIG